MLTIKASAKPSKIEGIGLFADEKIPKGTVTWRFNPRFDILFDPEEVKQMPAEHRELIYRYSYLSMTTNKCVYSIDDSRFTNHSSIKNNIDAVPAPGEQETLGVANRDIEEGEEILVNYRAFDAHDENSKEEYLND
ncbi:MAG: SET domain-containing protein-lysine N-methyltransferase [Parcubacteria group bacterium CG11_big_fil_rev_8_21_14_0_20_39_22]|nr:MAG: SET domain-containing protein-lysine N-methyltransferase [Parcubacteria group bacterium CG11_big_fil_rev_8_21_14_0_20_39_22]